MRFTFLLSIIITSALQAKDYLLEYGNDRYCIVHLNQAIDSVEYKDSDNSNVDIDTKQYRTLKVSFKPSQKESKMVIVSKQQRHKISYRYNQNFHKTCQLYIKKTSVPHKKIKLSQLKTEVSYVQAYKDKLSIALKKLKYLNQSLILELEIKNNRQKHVDIESIEINTFKRKGFLRLKAHPIKFFRNYKTNCKSVDSGKSKSCLVLIKNFYKHGHGLKLRFNLKNSANNYSLHHKF